MYVYGCSVDWTARAQACDLLFGPSYRLPIDRHPTKIKHWTIYTSIVQYIAYAYIALYMQYGNIVSMCGPGNMIHRLVLACPKPKCDKIQTAEKERTTKYKNKQINSSERYDLRKTKQRRTLAYWLHRLRPGLLDPLKSSS